MAPSCPGALGEGVTWVGWGQTVVQKCIHVVLLAARGAGGRRAQARRHPLPLPARELAQLLLPAAWGPRHWPESLCGGGGREREQSVTRTAPSPTPPRFPPTPAPPQPPEQGTRTTQAELSSTLPGAARKLAPRLEPPRESGAPEGRPVPAWGGERPLDGAGRDGGWGPSGRNWGGGPGEAAGGEALGDTRSLGGGGGASLRLGRGQSPDRAALQRLSSGTTRALHRSGGDEGAWRLGAPGGWRQGRAGPALPPGRGPSHVSRGASELKARGAPGIVGGRVRDGSR